VNGWVPVKRCPPGWQTKAVWWNGEPHVPYEVVFPLGSTLDWLSVAETKM